MNDSSSENPQSFAQSGLTDLPDSFSHEAQPGGGKYIVFNLGEKLYAVSAGQVAEVIQPLPATPLPKVPEWFSGIVNLRGKIISVINLPRLWGGGNIAAPKSKLILLRAASGENGIAFAVDKFSEIAVLPGEAIQPVKTTDAPYLLGKISYRSEELHLLDAGKIYSFICFRLETAR